MSCLSVFCVNFQIKNELSDITRVKDFAQWWVNNTDMIHEQVLNFTKTPLNQV